MRNKQVYVKMCHFASGAEQGDTGSIFPSFILLKGQFLVLVRIHFFYFGVLWVCCFIFDLFRASHPNFWLLFAPLCFTQNPNVFYYGHLFKPVFSLSIGHCEQNERRAEK